MAKKTGYQTACERLISDLTILFKIVLVLIGVVVASSLVISLASGAGLFGLGAGFGALALGFSGIFALFYFA